MSAQRACHRYARAAPRLRSRSGVHMRACMLAGRAISRAPRQARARRDACAPCFAPCVSAGSAHESMPPRYAFRCLSLFFLCGMSLFRALIFFFFFRHVPPGHVTTSISPTRRTMRLRRFRCIFRRRRFQLSPSLPFFRCRPRCRARFRRCHFATPTPFSSVFLRLLIFHFIFFCPDFHLFQPSRRQLRFFRLLFFDFFFEALLR